MWRCSSCCFLISNEHGGDNGMSSWATRTDRKIGGRIDRRMVSALVASTIITVLLVAPYLFRAV